MRHVYAVYGDVGKLLPDPVGLASHFEVRAGPLERLKKLGGLKADRYRQVLRIMELRPIPIVSERKSLFGRIFERHPWSPHSPLAPNRTALPAETP